MDLRNPNRANSGPDGTFVDRNTTPGAERPGTVIDANTFNQMLVEFENLIKAAGLEPSSSDLSQVLKTVEKLAIDISHPVGSYYQQFPNENGEFLQSEEPGVLFKNTIWDLMDYTDADGNGVFFRTEGGLSSEGRVDGVQSWALENIKGIYSDRFYGSGTGAFASIFTSSVSYNYAHSGDRGTYAADFDASRVVKTSTETRGLNMNFRIFRRYM